MKKPKKKTTDIAIANQMLSNHRKAVAFDQIWKALSRLDRDERKAAVESVCIFLEIDLTKP